MTANPYTDKLDSAAAVKRHLGRLVKRDPRLAAVLERAGPVAPRNTEAGFAGLANVVCGQQLSVASARAIWGRFAAVDGALDPRSFLLLPESTIRGTGFSAGKYRTLRVIAEAIATGDLDFSLIAELPAELALPHLIRHKGIGRWTAEIYLLFGAGHPDIFPSGDLALQKAVGHALGLPERPGVTQLAAIAEAWSPHRGAAALLFWRYYAAIRDSEGLAL